MSPGQQQIFPIRKPLTFILLLPKSRKELEELMAIHNTTPTHTHQMTKVSPRSPYNDQQIDVQRLLIKAKVELCTQKKGFC